MRNGREKGDRKHAGKEEIEKRRVVHELKGVINGERKSAKNLGDGKICAIEISASSI